MDSREKILATVKQNQPAPSELPPLPGDPAGQPGDASRTQAETPGGELSKKFTAVLESIGGSVYTVSGFGRIVRILRESYPDDRRILSSCPELASIATTQAHYDDAHTLENVDLAILRAHFGVAENGACWITEDLMIDRALPFITQHLALIIRKNDIVADMHAAYDRIAAMESAQRSAGQTPAAGYGFGTFIAGPSKTADIEQSLVLGAHGPRSMTIFMLDEGISDAGFY